MRLSNRNKTGFYSFINTFLLMIGVGGIGGFILEKYRLEVLEWQSYLFIVIPVLLLCILYFAGRQIFEYDSDGEALIFRNRNIIPFLNKPLNDEFPKYKLQSYDVIKILFYARLYVTIKSKKSHLTTLKYDISYLTKKEVGYLKYSLSKVIKANKENNSENQ